MCQALSIDVVSILYKTIYITKRLHKNEKNYKKQLTNPKNGAIIYCG